MPFTNEADRGPVTRADFDALLQSGVLEDSHVELLNGRIVSLNPHGGPHTFTVTRLAGILVSALGSRALVRVQAPFVTPCESEPEPDLAIVPRGDYGVRAPSTAFLLIEVADASLAHDRAKTRLYAGAGVPECWVVNLVDEVIEVYREPRGLRYARVTRHDRRAQLPVLGDLVVRVADIVPPRKLAGHRG
jgi:Uma2 family endonuclease